MTDTPPTGRLMAPLEVQFFDVLRRIVIQTSSCHQQLTFRINSTPVVLSFAFNNGTMPFSVSWHTLLEELEDLPDDATLMTPLSHDRFRVIDVQEQRIVIKFLNRNIDATRPLQRDQFEALYRNIIDGGDGFELENLPPDADPYPAVLSVHPRFEIDEDQGVMVEKEASTTSQILADGSETEPKDRTEPDLEVYADTLLLVDALERHEVAVLQDLETDVLVNLYTLLSDVQRNANDLRKDVADVLLDRLHHDRPVAGPFGSIQRTARRNRSLKDEDEVLSKLEEAGIDRERVLGIDREKVDDALEVTELSEHDVYEIEESEYVRKAEVDEERKETRLQGLKDQLAAAEGDEAEELRNEIEELESRIEELTEFKSGTQFHNPAGSEP